MVACVLSELKPSRSTFLALDKATYGLRPSASAFSTAKNVELLGLYPIPSLGIINCPHSSY